MTLPLLVWRGRPVVATPSVVVPFSDSFVDQNWMGYVSFWVSDTAIERGARELLRSHPNFAQETCRFVAIPYVSAERLMRDFVNVVVPRTEAVRWAILSLWGESHKEPNDYGTYLGPFSEDTRAWLGMTHRQARQVWAGGD